MSVPYGGPREGGRFFRTPVRAPCASPCAASYSIKAKFRARTAPIVVLCSEAYACSRTLTVVPVLEFEGKLQGRAA